MFAVRGVHCFDCDRRACGQTQSAGAAIGKRRPEPAALRCLTGSFADAKIQRDFPVREWRGHEGTGARTSISTGVISRQTCATSVRPLDRVTSSTCSVVGVALRFRAHCCANIHTPTRNGAGSGSFRPPRITSSDKRARDTVTICTNRWFRKLFDRPHGLPG